jgi:hypothetical protein
MPVKVVIKTSETLRMVHCPTHPAKLQRCGDHEATLEIPGSALAESPARALEVHVTHSGQPVSLAAMATRPSSHEDGFLGVTLTPPWQAPGPNSADQPSPPPQAILFVIDTSGSMADGTNKMDQAKRALSACIRQFRPADRFGIIRFSSSISAFRSELVGASTENRDAALEWIGQLNARGGTNISGALEEALALLSRSNSASTPTAQRGTVLFLTDGIANIGLTRPQEILALTRKTKTPPPRLFTFGLGYDVQTTLLDQLALESAGASEYVRPEEDLELPVERLFNKVSQPAMTNLRLVVEGAMVHDLTPTTLPDLFHGTQLHILGRYRSTTGFPTTATLKVTGELYGKPQEFQVRLQLPHLDSSAPWLETLWATRKLASLLDSYRADEGPAANDLKKEIEELCQRHNLVSPFTSLLVVEDGSPGSPIRPAAAASNARASRSALGGRSLSEVPAAQAPRDESRQEYAPVTLMATERSGEANTGAVAVERSLHLKRLRTGTHMGDAANHIRKDRRRIGSLTFELRSASGGQPFWAETSLPEPLPEPDLRICPLSPAWLELAQQPDLREILTLGTRTLFKRGTLTIEITDETASGCLEQLNDESRRQLKIR